MSFPASQVFFSPILIKQNPIQFCSSRYRPRPSLLPLHFVVPCSPAGRTILTLNCRRLSMDKFLLTTVSRALPITNTSGTCLFGTLLIQADQEVLSVSCEPIRANCYKSTSPTGKTSGCSTIRTNGTAGAEIRCERNP